MDEQTIKALVERVTEQVEEVVKYTDDKTQYIKWFLSELYNQLNLKYNIDGEQEIVDQTENKDIVFFWDIDENLFNEAPKRFGGRLRGTK